MRRFQNPKSLLCAINLLCVCVLDKDETLCTLLLLYVFPFIAYFITEHISVRESRAFTVLYVF